MGVALKIGVSPWFSFDTTPERVLVAVVSGWLVRVMEPTFSGSLFGFLGRIGQAPSRGLGPRGR